jgi:hypothetical protein
MRRLLLLALALGAGVASAADIDAIFAPLADAKSPGLAVLARQNGRTVFARGYGVRDLRTLARIDAKTDFRLASFTKQFTAMAVMLLANDGKLRYDRPHAHVAYRQHYGIPHRDRAIYRRAADDCGVVEPDGPGSRKACASGRTIIALTAAEAMLSSIPPIASSEIDGADNLGQVFVKPMAPRIIGVIRPYGISRQPGRLNTSEVPYRSRIDAFKYGIMKSPDNESIVIGAGKEDYEIGIQLIDFEWDDIEPSVLPI